MHAVLKRRCLKTDRVLHHTLKKSASIWLWTREKSFAGDTIVIARVNGFELEWTAPVEVLPLGSEQRCCSVLWTLLHMSPLRDSSKVSQCNGNA